MWTGKPQYAGMQSTCGLHCAQRSQKLLFPSLVIIVLFDVLCKRSDVVFPVCVMFESFCAVSCHCITHDEMLFFFVFFLFVALDCFNSFPVRFKQKCPFVAWCFCRHIQSVLHDNLPFCLPLPNTSPNSFLFGQRLFQESRVISLVRQVEKRQS